VHGDYKGTARQSVEPQLAAGQDVLLEIDWQGARQVKAKVPDALGVFILPPSREALESRMRSRGQDSERPSRAARRRARGDEPLRRVRLRHRQRGLRDGGVEMQAIFIGSRQRRHVQQQRHARLIAALLA
jgi:guanylate kinase